MFAHTFTISTLFIGFIFSNPIVSPGGDGINYELLGGGIEGDMILPDGFDPKREFDGKGVAIFGPRRWPNNIIPYDISAITNAGQRTMIESAMKILSDAVSTPIAGSTSRKPCVTFRPKISTDQVFVKIQYGTGCSASVGYSSGARTLTLQNSGCFRSGIIQHELIHVLGFYHEQSRPDRDLYVTVNHNNIEIGKEHNFNKYTWGSTVLDQKSPYDFGSIMHYSSTSFSANGLPTITPKQAGAIIGQRDQVSAIDINEIRQFYSCTI
ncbi:unnamed protein product [Rotaria magnacalcarata]|uniref:Metalloendopeptidase n=4 Tax=Rotaria magnacalcarata TaxID=392030 RepID=A0A816SXR9_9BILA|nr:unnamed protein product [Rotaria magnacalcarata]CAF1614258.1 unnamed protein product [Rotaria magnacalcarata]CAF2093721.1 unnamed protein product [Rotaria magnacalcarata]CAF5049650.1 unnamed protein product [Rotaria magnacalcarata]